MADTAARLLALLSLLQSRPRVDRRRAGRTPRASRPRTIRNDIDRLRELGYPVDADPRLAPARYRLGAGGKLPPLLLDDEEAVAVAIGLRAATAASPASSDAQRPGAHEARAGAARSGCGRRWTRVATAVDRAPGERRHRRCRIPRSTHAC